MRAVGIAALLAASLLLGSCSQGQDALAEQYQESTTSNYVSGDGAVTVLAPESRLAPVTFGGPLDREGTFDSSDYAGDVLVVNFWYAGCPPCRLEARDLEALHQLYQGMGVTFIGVNILDQSPTALAFAEEFGVTYPSVMDVATGQARLAFAGSISPNAVPTTLVLDREHRVAGRISGLLTDPGVLQGMIDSALDEAR